MTKALFKAVTIILILAAAMFAGFSWNRLERPKMTTPYQAVLLTNGSVYFGRLEGLGSRFPVLRDVYYVQSGVDPQTKEQKNILLKRGNEWHSPDHMIINASQIVLIEPVGPNSRVAALIEQVGH